MNMSAPVRRENLWKWLCQGLSLCWLLAAGLLPSTAPAQEALRLEAIDVQPLPGQQVELRLRLSGTAPEPMTFTIDDPARISLDLPNTTLAPRVAPPGRQRRPADDGSRRRSERPHARRHEPELDGSLSNARRRRQRLRVDRPRRPVTAPRRRSPRNRARAAALAARGRCRGRRSLDPQHRLPPRRRRRRPNRRRAQRSAHDGRRSPRRRAHRRRLPGHDAAARAAAPARRHGFRDARVHRRRAARESRRAARRDGGRRVRPSRVSVRQSIHSRAQAARPAGRGHARACSTRIASTPASASR